MNRYVLGMAKTPLDLRGGKERSLRLDLSQLISAVRLMKLNKNDAHGYLLVITDQSYRFLRRWVRNYDGLHDVTVLKATLLSREEDDIQTEKLMNSTGKNSVAKRAKEIGESHLLTEISKREPGVRLCSQSYPMNVSWDYFGIR